MLSDAVRHEPLEFVQMLVETHGLTADDVRADQFYAVQMGSVASPYYSTAAWLLDHFGLVQEWRHSPLHHRGVDSALERLHRDRGRQGWRTKYAAGRNARTW